MSDNGTDRCSKERHRLSTLPDDLLGRLDVVERGPAEAALLLETGMSVARGLDLLQVLRSGQRPRSVNTISCRATPRDVSALAKRPVRPASSP
ncbi:hypothetical protein ACFYXM_30525 [Streptomyces sp. NPDC002476]|uniref:hypothetical protein n=1 Tax=Streptomyces sp. NPDC002476 TaxID=3364648 RepID=UPI00369A289D